MIRLYYKLRYNEDDGVYELYDPHSNKVIAMGEGLAYLKVKAMDDTFVYHPINEEDLIQLIDKQVIIHTDYDPKKEIHETLADKIVIGWTGNEYIKSVIQGRNRL